MLHVLISSLQLLTMRASSSSSLTDEKIRS